jgi:glycosyltransferase involved in cell wall biosynthesis
MTDRHESQPKKLLLLIRSLHIGGAERQVVSLAKSLSALGIEVQVAVKISGGPLERDLESISGIILHHLGGSGLIGRLKYLLQLRSLIKSNKFDAVYGFMPGPNLALLVAKTLQNSPLIAWGVRTSGIDTKLYGGRVKWTMRLEKWLSRFADRVITNSQVALDEYRLIGYPQEKLVHVPNAIDTQRFKFDPDARKKIETEFEIAPDDQVVGIFARIHPMKDHTTFIQAARTVLKSDANVKFICAGETSDGYSEYAQQIKSIAAESGINEKVLWVGPRTDIESLMSGCDITTLTSNSGEGFPNSVAESLACGTPCVVTDVGDASAIVSTHGSTVPRNDSEALAAAWNTHLSLARSDTGERAENARQSIVDRYSPEAIGSATLKALSR